MKQDFLIVFYFILKNPVHPVQKNFLLIFLRSAPHCVRRFSRNDSGLMCHPKRS